VICQNVFFVKISIFVRFTRVLGNILLSYCDKVISRGNINQKHRIGGVMVSVLASSAVDRVKPRTMKLVFVVSPLSTQHYGERAKIVWLGIRIMCPNGMTFLPG
jgi:hypothetical protein